MANKVNTVWKVFFADQEFIYFTRYHAEQFARALTSNRTPCVLEGSTTLRDE